MGVREAPTKSTEYCRLTQGRDTHGGKLCLRTRGWYWAGMTQEARAGQSGEEGAGGAPQSCVTGATLIKRPKRKPSQPLASAVWLLGIFPAEVTRNPSFSQITRY